MSDYPEHDKLKEVQPLSEAIYEFLEWCEQGGRVMCVDSGEDYFPILASRETLLAEHFGIDLNKIEAEKRQMLDRQRKLNEEGG